MPVTTLENLSQEQLAVMTTEQVAALIDIECALAGIGLMPPLPVDPMVNKPAPDLTAWTVDKMYFASAEAAQRVIAAANAEQRFDLDYGTDTAKHVVKARELLPDAVSAFSVEAYASLKADLAEATKRQNLYLGRKREYDAVAQKRIDVSRRVWRAVNDARERAAWLAESQLLYRRYLTLAQGDAFVAGRFFTNAYAEAVEEFGLDAISEVPAVATCADEFGEIGSLASTATPTD
jgi:hypothetical protein